MSYDEVRDDCLDRRTLFEDPDFPATAKSISAEFSSPCDWIWKRPHEFCDRPRFLVDGASRFDFAQGELGDCWFVAAAAVLATKKELFVKVVPPDQSFTDNYAGVFRFRFWQFGSWREVIVDDRLPVTVDGQLRFAYNRSTPDEFWSALFEKAYAKLHRSYEAIAAGYVRDALVDFTGGVSEEYNLRHEDRLPPDLYDVIHASHIAGSLMGCGIWGERGSMVEERVWNGLYKGHAYSITSVLHTRIAGWPVKLLRLRNPWGELEWTGPWSDSSDEWRSMSADDRRNIGLRVEDDGEFWMCFKDWLTNFHALDIVHLTADSFARDDNVPRTLKWHEAAHHGRWVKGVSAGGCSLFSGDSDVYYTNPQFHMRLEHPDVDDVVRECTCVISLLQKQYRKRKNSPQLKNLIIGFDVHLVKDGRRDVLTSDTVFTKAVLKKKFRARTTHREVSCRLTLDPGLYCVIPNTLRSNQQSDFLLRIFTYEKITSGALGDDGRTDSEFDTKAEAPPIGTISSDTYWRFAGDDNTIDARDLRDLLNDLARSEFGRATTFGLEACRSLIAFVDTEQCGVLDFEETVTLWNELLYWKKLFVKYDHDKTGSIETYELRKVFADLGIHLSIGVASVLALRYGGKEMTLFYEDFALCIAKSISLNVAFKKYSAQSAGEARLSLEQWMGTMLYL